MRIGVASDSHGSAFMLERAIKAMGDIDMLVFLGDGLNDLHQIASRYSFDIESVAGNNDFALRGESCKILRLCGKKIMITHGHRYRVNWDLNTLYYAALENEADLVLYGHTHVQSVEWQRNVLMVNPGSVSLPRDMGPGCCVIEIDDAGEFHVNSIRI